MEDGNRDGVTDGQGRQADEEIERQQGEERGRQWGEERVIYREPERYQLALPAKLCDKSTKSLATLSTRRHQSWQSRAGGQGGCLTH